jgi:thiol-disulfide isomerase/thioredoxin
MTRIFAFCLFTFYFLLVLACNPARPVSVSNQPVRINNVPQTNAPLPPAKPIEEMYWAKFDGQIEKIKDLQGKVIVLDFWATYCGPCLQAIPHFVELQKKHSDLQVVGLHVGGEEDRPKVPEFADKLKINYTLATPEDALSNFIFAGTTNIPQTAIFDKKGNLIKKFIGFDESIKTDIDKTIAEALK